MKELKCEKCGSNLIWQELNKTALSEAQEVEK